MSQVPMNQDRARQDVLAQQLQGLWEQNWQQADYQPSWLSDDIPQALTEAVAMQWFPPGARLLDIGCGSGELSAWLAARSYQVVGVDFSSSAIQRARNTYPEQGGTLSFQVADMCRDAPASPSCSALFDRGCLHGLPKLLYAAYARTVAAWALPNAHFLLLCGVNQGEQVSNVQEAQLRNEMCATLETIFSPYFVIHKQQPAIIQRRAPRKPAPGLALWMIRHEE